MRTHTFEVVYIDDTGNEVTAEIDAISQRSLRQILGKKSIDPVHIRCTTGFVGNRLGCLAWICLHVLSGLLCLMQLFGYYGIYLEGEEQFRVLQDSSISQLALFAVATALGYSAILLLALGLSGLALLLARNTSYRSFSKKWTLALLAWSAIHFVYFTGQILNA